MRNFDTNTDITTFGDVRESNIKTIIDEKTGHLIEIHYKDYIINKDTKGLFLINKCGENYFMPDYHTEYNGSFDTSKIDELEELCLFEEMPMYIPLDSIKSLAYIECEVTTDDDYDESNFDYDRVGDNQSFVIVELDDAIYIEGGDLIYEEDYSAFIDKKLYK